MNVALDEQKVTKIFRCRSRNKSLQASGADYQPRSLKDNTNVCICEVHHQIKRLPFLSFRNNPFSALISPTKSAFRLEFLTERPLFQHFLEYKAVRQ